MRKATTFFAAISMLSALAVSPSQALDSKAKITKPSAPTVVTVTSSAPKKGKVNVTVTISLPSSNGGSAITGSKVTAGGRSCTIKKLKTSCTIKSVKNGKALSVVASSKNKKGFGAKSSRVAYTAGSAAYASAPVASSSPVPVPANAGCTIIGTEVFETLIGSSGDDVICALGGDDIIYGMGGNDTIYGGAGNDTIYGDGQTVSSFLPSFFVRNLDAVSNPGNDTMDGGPGIDTLFGGPGINPCRGNGTTWDSGDNLDYLSCEDVTPPRVVSWTISTSNVDTRSAAADFSHTIRIEDDLAGFPACGASGTTSNVNFVSVFYRNSTQQNGGGSAQYPQLANANTNCSFGYNGAVTTINTLTADGRVLDITATVNNTLPRFSRLGTWDAHVEMRDMTTNYGGSIQLGPVNGG
jgi:hypothetical protein